jgi:hypothetical protein
MVWFCGEDEDVSALPYGPHRDAVDAELTTCLEHGRIGTSERYRNAPPKMVLNWRHVYEIPTWETRWERERMWGTPPDNKHECYLTMTQTGDVDSYLKCRMEDIGEDCNHRFGWSSRLLYGFFGSPTRPMMHLVVINIDYEQQSMARAAMQASKALFAAIKRRKYFRYLKQQRTGPARETHPVYMIHQVIMEGARAWESNDEHDEQRREYEKRLKTK